MTRVMILLYSILMLGCSMPEPAAPQRHYKALQLIDQGVIALRSHKLDSAEASFHVARDIEPLAAAYDGLGCVALLRGEFKMAEHYYRQAYEMDFEYESVLGNLALLYELKGDRTQAEKMYRQAIRLDPDNFRTRNNYAGFMSAEDESGEGRSTIIGELLKAQALAHHPFIDSNLSQLQYQDVNEGDGI